MKRSELIVATAVVVACTLVLPLVTGLVDVEASVTGMVLAMLLVVAHGALRDRRRRS